MTMNDYNQHQYARCPQCQGRIELIPPSEREYRSWSLDEPSPTVDYKITYVKCDGEGHNVKVFWKKPFFTGYG
jgi:hypothetical protein